MNGKLYERALLDAGAAGFILKIASTPKLISGLRVDIRMHEQGQGQRSE